MGRCARGRRRSRAHVRRSESFPPVAATAQNGHVRVPGPWRSTTTPPRWRRGETGRRRRLRRLRRHCNRRRHRHSRPHRMLREAAGCGDAAAGFEVEVGRDEAAVVIANAAARDGRTAPRGLRSPIGVTLPDKDGARLQHNDAAVGEPLERHARPRVARLRRSRCLPQRRHVVPELQHALSEPLAARTRQSGHGGRRWRQRRCDRRRLRCGRRCGRPRGQGRRSEGRGHCRCTWLRNGCGSAAASGRAAASKTVVTGRGRAEVRTASFAAGAAGAAATGAAITSARCARTSARNFWRWRADAAVATGRGRPAGVGCSCGSTARRVSSRPTATASCSAVWTYSRSSRSNASSGGSGEEAVDGPNIPSSDSGAQASGFFSAAPQEFLSEYECTVHQN